MRVFKGRGRSVFGGLALAAAFALAQVASASAATFPNACKNSASVNASQINIEMTADAPAMVFSGDPVTLSNIQQTLAVPGGIFLAGYNLGLLTVGENTIPATATTIIEATNTLEGAQATNTASSSISTTITDPDGSPSTGDESASDGAMSLTYASQAWTAAGGTIQFREDTVDPVSAGSPPAGGVTIVASIPNPGPKPLQVRFGCSPGTVSGPDPGVITYDDPAASFASTMVEGQPIPIDNDISFGKVKLNKKKGTAKLPVTVPRAGKLKLKKTSKVKGASTTATGAGTVNLMVKPLGKAKKDLKKRGKAKVKASVTFTAEVGEPATKSKKLTLEEEEEEEEEVSASARDLISSRDRSTSSLAPRRS